MLTNHRARIRLFYERCNLITLSEAIASHGCQLKVLFQRILFTVEIINVYLVAPCINSLMYDVYIEKFE